MLSNPIRASKEVIEIDYSCMHSSSSTVVEEPACPLLLAAVGVALLLLQIANDG
jgi:hypothetical protein